MSNDSGYRVVTTERLRGGGDSVRAVFPPLNEPPLDRPSAVERLDLALKVYSTARSMQAEGEGWEQYRQEGNLATELLPTGRCRLKVVTDEQARSMSAARELAGAR